jgi:hypothetical protein
MTLGLPEVTTHEQQCGTSSWYRKFRRLDDVRVNSPSTLADDAHVQVPALESPLDCKRSASIVLPQRSTRFRRNARPRRRTGSDPVFRRNTAERVYTTEAAHNPEVAGSNPAPATAKRPRERGFSPTTPALRRDSCKRTTVACQTSSASCRREARSSAPAGPRTTSASTRPAPSMFTTRSPEISA